MKTVVRYKNRKLYDQEAHKYITLNGILDILKGGTQVTVVNHGTNEDVTNDVLSQIVVSKASALNRGQLVSLLTTTENGVSGF